MHVLIESDPVVHGRMHLVIVAVMALLLAAGCTPTPAAQTPVAGPTAQSAAQPTDPFPTQAVKVVIAATGGDPHDVLVRRIAPVLTRGWGVDIRPVNLLGPQRVDFFEDVYAARPDGHTIGFGSDANYLYHDLFPGLLKFQLREFEVLLAIRTLPDAVYASPASKVKSAQEFFSATQPVRLGQYGALASGIASLVITAQERNVPLQVVTFPTYPEAHAALLRGDVDVIRGTASGTTTAYVRTGEYIPLWVWGTERFAELPTAPSSTELGLNPILHDSTLYRVFMTTPKTPPDRAARLTQGLRAALADPETIQWGKEASQPLTEVSAADWLKVHNARIELYRQHIPTIQPFVG